MQQQCVFSALCTIIRKICHVYLDDIIIWLNSLTEHETNVALVLEALWKGSLYCLVQKSILFCTEVDFLGHHISERGIEADPKKVDRILNWQVPKSAT